MTRPSAQSGFTLVETLASLAIMALVGLMLLQGIHAVNLWRARRAADDGGRSVAAAQTLLRGRLVRVFPYTSSRTGFPLVDFTGLPDRLQFVAPPPDAGAPDALQHYDLGLNRQGQLALITVSDLALQADLAQRRLPLLNGVSRVEIDYFGPAAPDNLPRWRQRWEQQGVLPSLVRIRVGFPAGDRRVWPDLIVNAAATLDSRCDLEPTTGLCRGRS